MQSPFNPPYTLPSEMAMLPYTVVRSHNSTRYEADFIAALTDYVARVAATAHASTTVFNGPPVLPMNFVRRAFLENQGSPQGRLQEIAQVLIPRGDPRAMALGLATTSTGPVAPHIASPGARAIHDSMVPMPTRVQRRGRGYSTLIPLQNPAGPPVGLYDGSASSIALDHLRQQQDRALGPTMQFVQEQIGQSVGGGR
jgi:hypothetical protein